MAGTKRAESNAFHPGSRGVCEARWKFRKPQTGIISGKGARDKADCGTFAGQALQYLRRWHGYLNIDKAGLLGMIALLTGSPLD